MKISHMYEGFQRLSRMIKLEEVVFITEVVEVGEYMSLRISSRRRSTIEVLNNGLES